MRIQNNISALNTHRNYGINNAALAKSTERLSSGYRINRAADDAAGLAVSEKMRAQIRGLEVSSRNAQDGVSLVQTAEGYLQDAQDILHRMKDVANQLANGIYDANDYANAQIEYSQLVSELDYILNNAEFNGVSLFGTASVGLGDAAGALDSSIVDAMDWSAIFDAAGIDADCTDVEVNADFTMAGTSSAAKIEYTITWTDAAGNQQTETFTITANAGEVTGTIGDYLFENDGTAITLNGNDISSYIGDVNLSDAGGKGSDDYDLAVTFKGAKNITLQVGYKTDDTMELTIDSISTGKLGAINVRAESVKDQTAAQHALDELYKAIDEVSGVRAKFGAYQNRLEFKISSIDNAVENLTAAESRIRDVDMAKEMTEYTKQNILSQAATAMLAQANSQPQLVLQLLG